MAENNMSENTAQTRSPDEEPDMDELLAIASPAERAMAAVDRLLNDSSEPKPQSKESHVASDVKLYSDDLGRNHFMDEIQAKGSFYVAPSTSLLVVLNIIIVPLSGVVTFIVLALLTVPLAIVPFKVFGIILTVFEIAATLAAMFLAFYHCVTKTRGPLHFYKADGRAFYVAIKGKKIGGNDQILFRDVVGINYTPTKFLWGDRGYKVDILTTYGTVRYNYIFPSFNHRLLPGKLPFDVIARNIPDRKQDQK